MLIARLHGAFLPSVQSCATARAALHTYSDPLQGPTICRGGGPRGYAARGMTLDYSREQIAMAVALFIVSTLVSSVLVGGFLVLIPEDHFVSKRRSVIGKVRQPAARIALVIGKNLLGVVLILIGLVLSLPGVPGQGLLTVLVGIVLLDVPGKRGFERRLVRRPTLRRNIDRLRARFDKPPLLLEPTPPDSVRETASDPGAPP
jgi:hypothetical protein